VGQQNSVSASELIPLYTAIVLTGISQDVSRCPDEA